MARKRLSQVRAKPNQIRLKFGLCEGERDFVAAHGDGTARGDSYLLFDVLTVMRKERPCAIPGAFPDQPSILDELEARGYDPKTLEITIQKKP
jgi:hypothetical protein